MIQCDTAAAERGGPWREKIASMVEDDRGKHETYIMGFVRAPYLRATSV